MTDIYFNLHRHCWSLRIDGRVEAYPLQVIVQNARFVVQPGGNARVRREGRKQVHAFVRAQRTSVRLLDSDEPIMLQTESVNGVAQARITYNPYKHTSFVDAETGCPVTEAGLVVMTSDRQVYAWDIDYADRRAA